MKQWLYQVLIRSGLWGLVLWVALFFICLALVCQSLLAGRFDVIPWALWLLAILTHITAAQRFLRARRLLQGWLLRARPGPWRHLRGREDHLHCLWGRERGREGGKE